MRVWDIHPKHLCRKHLLAEHRELHGLWNILTKHKGKGGYSRHPETLRWHGKLKALYNRHEQLAKEFKRRGYAHRSLLDKKYATGSGSQRAFINTVSEQKAILKEKPCGCFSDSSSPSRSLNSRELPKNEKHEKITPNRSGFGF